MDAAPKACATAARSAWVHVFGKKEKTKQSHRVLPTALDVVLFWYIKLSTSTGSQSGAKEASERHKGIR